MSSTSYFAPWQYCERLDRPPDARTPRGRRAASAECACPSRQRWDWASPGVIWVATINECVSIQITHSLCIERTTNSHNAVHTFVSRAWHRYQCNWRSGDRRGCGDHSQHARPAPSTVRPTTTEQHFISTHLHKSIKLIKVKWQKTNKQTYHFVRFQQKGTAALHGFVYEFNLWINFARFDFERPQVLEQHCAQIRQIERQSFVKQQQWKHFTEITG